MGRPSAEQSGIGRWMFHLGYAGTRIGDRVQEVRDAAAGLTANMDRATAEVDRIRGEAPGATRAQVATLATTTAAGMLFTRLFRARSVHWPRAVLAGTIGTLLYDAETIVADRVRVRKFGTTAARQDAPPAPGVRETALRYAAGIGMAAFYGRYLYGRIPGPPLLQGVAYGLLESGTRGWGGAVALLTRMVPDLDVPAAYEQGLGRAGETPLRAIRGHLLFGVALGLLYRAGRDG